VTGGTRWQVGPVGSGRGEIDADGWVRPKQKPKIQKYSNWTELNWSKNGLPQLKQFQIKYEVEVFEPRNNFIHRNFSRFEMDFKLKFQKSKV
jgi:hypothetical protein